MNATAPEQVARDVFALVGAMTRSEALELARLHASVPWVRAALGRYLAGAPVRVWVLGLFAVPRGAVPWPSLLFVVGDGRRTALVAVFPAPDGSWSGRALDGGARIPWESYRGSPAGDPGTASQGDVPWLAGDSYALEDGVFTRGLAYLRSLPRAS